MKICIISTLFRPLSRGGAELVAERVAAGLKAQGHTVFVISLNTYRPWNIASFQNLAKLPAFVRPLWHVLDMFNLHTFFVVRNILKKEKPDLVLSHNIKGLGYTVPRAVTSCHIPYAHTLHDVQLVEPSGLIMNNSDVPNSLYSYITRALFGSPTMVISPSQFLMDFYTSHGFFKNSKKLVLPNPSLKSVIARLHNDNTVLTLLYLTLLEPHKGILFLIETLKTWNKPFHLIIGGTGSCEQRIKELTHNDARFEMLGYVQNTNIAPLLAQSDATIIPSLCIENAPLLINDSFTYGVPVVASHVGGIPEMIQEGVNGFTFEVGNAADLLEKLSRIKNLKYQAAPLQTIEKYLQTLLYAAK